MADPLPPKRNSAYIDINTNLISDQLDIGYWKLNLETEEIFWGAATQRIHEVDDDYIPDLATAIQFYDTIEPGRIAITEAVDHIIRTGEAYDIECRFVTAKGNKRWVRTAGHALFDSQGKMTHLEGIFQDISHYKQMQETSFFIQKELNYMTYALDHHAIVSMADTEGSIIYVNDLFCQASKYDQSALLEKNHSVVASGHHDSSFWETFWKTISSGKIYKGEICNRRQDGEYYWVNTTVVPHLDTDNKIDRYISISTDITEDKRIAEHQKAMEQSLFRSQKMEALGQAVGGIAHDFNNILAVAMGYTQLLLLKAPDPNAPELKAIRNIDAAANKAKLLIDKMLSFARGSSDESSHIHLSRKLKDFSQFIDPLLPVDIELQIGHVDDNIQLLMAESSLDQILLNLAINARDAIGDKGVITLEAEAIDADCGYCQSCGQAINASYVQLRVKDNGPGLHGISTDEIFQPFYSTKEPGKGSGMGLSVVHGLLHGIGGHIQAFSGAEQGAEEGAEKGAEFIAYIPNTQQSKPTQSKSVQSSLPELDNRNELNGLTLAVVDDEEGITSMLTEFFSLFGARMISYNNALNFIHDLEKTDLAFDLALLDITMPRLSGIEVCKKIREHSQARVIAMSGYSDKVTPASFGQYGFDGFLSKPINMKQAIDLVRQLIAAHSNSPES
ncbi:MAG: hypothetical protein AseanaTS_08430 [Candidatus Pelagadaptatus aseana]